MKPPHLSHVEELDVRRVACELVLEKILVEVQVPVVESQSSSLVDLIRFECGFDSFGFKINFHDGSCVHRFQFQFEFEFEFEYELMIEIKFEFGFGY